MGAGARQEKACEVLELDRRTLQRWQSKEKDERRGPKSKPSHALSPAERAEVLSTLNSPEFRNLSPNQVVPRLADQGRYLASESTMYRILAEEKQNTHRGPCAPPSNRPQVAEHVATGPNQVWTWDITYLKRPVRGLYYYMYMAVDVWSRKMVGAQVFEAENGENSHDFLLACLAEEGISGKDLVIHSDNGAPMKASTLRATLEDLGVTTSFSRPRVSNDNPFSESLFGTTKTRPEYPREGFESLGYAQEWTRWFRGWYNTDHQHSSIKFTTPDQRHNGEDLSILKKRSAVYEEARRRNPARWSRKTRDWSWISTVRLNPQMPKAPALEMAR